MMQMNVLSTELKRQVIEIGLLSFLHGERLERALSYWEQHYCFEPSYALNRFLNDICQSDDLKPMRRNMLKSLFVEINFVEKIEDVRSNISQVLENRQEERLLQQGVALLVQHFVQQLSSQHSDKFLQEVVTKVEEKTHKMIQYNSFESDEWLQQVHVAHFPYLVAELERIYGVRYGIERAAQVMEIGKIKAMKHYPSLNIEKLMFIQN